MASLYPHRILLLILVMTSMRSEGQPGAPSGKQDQSAQLKNLIVSRKFSFHPNSATSMKGMTKHLTGEYFLKVNKDSLQADLPYYGRSFTTSYPPTDLSVQFTTTKFSYVADSTKKGGWSITIIPKNENSASKIYMSVSSTGYCTVQVNSNSRQPISYYGTISAYDAR